MKEKIIDSIVRTLKDYRESRNPGELIEVIKGYSKLHFYKEVKKYIKEFLRKGGGTLDLMKISTELPEKIKNVIYPGEFEIDGEFDADSFLEMGELLWEIGSPDEAKENYLKAFEYYTLLGNSEASKEVLKTMKQNYPGDEDVGNLVMRDPKDEIITALKNLKETFPKDELDLRYALGRRFHREDLLGEAEANYRRILELDNSHNARRLLVAVLREKGSFEESLKLARELKENEKKEELYSIFEALEESGKEEKIEAVLEEIYKIDPNFKDVRELLGVSEEETEVKKEKVSVESPSEVVSKGEVKDKTEDAGRRDEDLERKKIVFL